MANFEQIKQALVYIDDHLGEDIQLEALARRFHFSAYYFHRMFSRIVGKSLAAHIRDRRLAQACVLLADSRQSILHIGMDCGFHSAQAFSRVFKNSYGLSPSAYRSQGIVPVVVPVDDMIMKFTNRLKGGIYVNPNIIKRDAMLIAGVTGDGNKTHEVWAALEALASKTPLAGKLSGNGYEVRLYEDGKNTVHAGYLVAQGTVVDPAYTVCALPTARYAAFDVYVTNGYTSENNAMQEWLTTNRDGYTERLLGKAHYCVEYYDERFNGEEAGSIVEIWPPIEKGTNKGSS